MLQELSKWSRIGKMRWSITITRYQHINNNSCTNEDDRRKKKDINKIGQRGKVSIIPLFLLGGGCVWGDLFTRVVRSRTVTVLRSGTLTVQGCGDLTREFVTFLRLSLWRRPLRFVLREAEPRGTEEDGVSAERLTLSGWHCCFMSVPGTVAQPSRGVLPETYYYILSHATVNNKLWSACHIIGLLQLICLLLNEVLIIG